MYSEDFIQELLQEVEKFNINDIPNIDLYMDQVTTYLGDKFKVTKRHKDDKLMTKTMINNYVKSHLLPSPEKKKYSKDHIMALIMIYFFKNIISINDVTKLLTPLFDSYFHNEELSLESIINSFLDYIKTCNLQDSILKEFDDSKKIFEKKRQQSLRGYQRQKR